jgi:hypothetical protein
VAETPTIDQNAIVQQVAREVLAGLDIESLARRRGVSAYALDNPQNYTSGQSPRIHPGSQVSVDFLRQVADMYDPLRACINHLKREVSAVPLKVVSMEDKDDSEATNRNIKLATAFLSNQGAIGGPGKRRSHFEGKVIEDLCVVGATAVYFDLPVSVDTIDAATIRPLVDEQGYAPESDDDPAYEQWIRGIVVGTYSRNDLYYDGIYPVSYSPYFKCPVEYLINCINSALRADDWNRKWLTDGNAPARLYGAPDDWTPQQIRDFQEYLDAMLSGDSATRQKAKVVPGGFKDLGQNRKDQDFQEFELWLLRRTCAIMGVTPASIGFAGEQYKVSQEGSQEVTTQFGVGVLLDFLTAFYDDLWPRLGLAGIRTQRVTAKEEDASDRAERNKTLVSAGIKSINEARADEGLDPKDGADELLVINTTTTLDAVLNPPEPQPMNGGESNNGNQKENGGQSPGVGEAQQGGGRQTGQRQKSGQKVATSTSRALAQWERKAISRLRPGKSAACGFESSDIPQLLRLFVEQGLAESSSPAEIRAIFNRAREAHIQRDDDDGGEWVTINGEHILIGGAGSGNRTGQKLSEKAQRAKDAHKMTDKEVQRYSEEHNEPMIAKQLGGMSFPDSEPVDIAAPDEHGVVQHGLEVKTIVDNSNGKITMDTYAQVRKINWEQANKATLHTLVVDDSKVFNAKGPGLHDESQREFYYRRGAAGSARINSMYKAGSMDEVKQLMSMPEKDLPKGAARSDGALREGKWKEIPNERGFRNTVTGREVRPKK